MFNNIDQQQSKNLLIGVLVIYSTYSVSEIYYSQLMKTLKDQKDKQFFCPEGIIFLASAFTWLLAFVFNKVNFQNPTKIPQKNSFLSGLCIFTSLYTFAYAYINTNFSVIMIFKSSKILFVLLVAVFCTKVTDKALNLNKNKFITGGILAIGLLVYYIFSPELSQKGKQGQIPTLSIGLLFISVLADGFLPDLQAEIKSLFKPKPTEMMEKINKWVAILSLFILLINFNLPKFFTYLFDSKHSSYLKILILFCILTAIGQFFIYRLVKDFKQHIVPFALSSRKTLTIYINIIIGRGCRALQFVGILMISAAAFYEFISEVKKYTQIKAQKFENVEDWKEVDLETQRSALQVASSEHDQIKQ